MRLALELNMAEFYKEIIDAIPIALLVLDKDSKIIMANRSLWELLSCEGKPEGMALTDLIPHERLKRFVSEATYQGFPREMELHAASPRGNLKALKVIAVGLRSRESANDHSLVLIEDVGEKIRLEQQLVETEKQAGMGQLAASIAHELGNPLGIMGTTLQFLQQRLRERNDDLAAEMEIILDNLNRMHELLRDLSEFTGPARRRVECGDLHQSLSHVLAFIAKEAEERKVIITTDFDNAATRCLADHRELKQVFLNLFKNALEAMDGGGNLTVRTSNCREKSVEDNSSVRIEISDTGMGIAECELDLIFRPFYSTKKGGMGMGLPFCRRVIEDHDGEIGVESIRGRGTTFSVTLPLHSDRREGNEHI